MHPSTVLLLFHHLYPSDQNPNTDDEPWPPTRRKKRKKKSFSLHKQRVDYKHTDLKGEKQRGLPGAPGLDLLTPVMRNQLQSPCTDLPFSQPLGLWVHCSLCWNTSTRPTHCQPSCLFLQEFFSNPQCRLNALALCFDKPLDYLYFRTCFTH